MFDDGGGEVEGREEGERRRRRKKGRERSLKIRMFSWCVMHVCSNAGNASFIRTALPPLRRHGRKTYQS